MADIGQDLRMDKTDCDQAERLSKMPKVKLVSS
jgi:hypothetical protein